MEGNQRFECLESSKSPERYLEESEKAPKETCYLCDQLYYVHCNRCKQPICKEHGQVIPADPFPIVLCNQCSQSQ